METSLHRQLKLLYAVSEAQTEVTVDGFRIDAVSSSGELVEIQHASLGALRDKTRRLLSSPTARLRIVKPIVTRKRLVTLVKPGGEVKRNRMSPKRSDQLDLFLDLVHFMPVFPRKRLTLEVVLIESEEVRVDTRQRTWRSKPFKVLDQRLSRIVGSFELRTKAELLAELPSLQLPVPFDTAELAAAMQRPRWFAQKVAYCLRQCGAARADGKRGNAQLYRIEPKLLQSVARIERRKASTSGHLKAA